MYVEELLHAAAHEPLEPPVEVAVGLALAVAVGEEPPVEACRR